MFTHPLELNIISNIDDKCIQPNAVDIRVSEMKIIDDIEHTYSSYHDQLLVISEDGTEHKKKPDLVLDSDGFWHLYRGTYEFSTQHYVTVPHGYAGYLITRSSLNRNGVFILSGLYDSGFTGYVGGTLYNLGGRMKIQYGTRICQFVLLKAETAKLYTGQYNHDKNPENTNTTSLADNNTTG